MFAADDLCRRAGSGLDVRLVVPITTTVLIQEREIFYSTISADVDQLSPQSELPSVCLNEP
jgi:hypothetical protein